MSCPDSDVDLSRNGDREPLFEGFSFPREGFHFAHASRLISILQVAECRVLAGSIGSPIVSLPSSPGMTSSHAFSAASASRALGFHRRVCWSRLDPGDRVGPFVAVQCSSPAGGHLSGVPTTQLSVLVCSVGPGLGGEPARPVCLGLLVDPGAETVHQPSRAPGHSPRPSPLRSLSRGSHSWDLYGQHHSPVLHPQTGQDVLSCPEPGSPTPPSLGGGHGSHAGAPVHHGGTERGCGLSEQSGPGHQF